MSYLIGPRINFKGAFKTNPCTTNNDDVMVALDPSSLELNLGALGMSDDEAREWLKQSIRRAPSKDDEELKNYIRGGWNVYGDYATSFQNAQVTTVYNAGGAAGEPSEDPLVTKSVYILGSRERTAPVIVDLDPIGLTGSQIFLGGFQLGDDTLGISARCDVRAYSCWLAFNRVLGKYNGEQNFVGLGAVWQLALPRAALTFKGEDSSPVLRALKAAVEAASGAGLLVRFTCFEVQPYLNTPELASAFASGQGPQNPGIGYLVGTVGVWSAGEPTMEPPGRLLINNVGPNGALIPGVGVTQAQWSGGGFLPGNCAAQVDTARKVVALDLITTFPKEGFRNPDGPPPGASYPQGFDAVKKQADVGPVELALIPSGGSADQARSIGPIDYGLADYGKYEDHGGIVEVPYGQSLLTDTDLANGTLIIRGTEDNPSNKHALFVSEVPTRVICDDRAVYLRSSQEKERDITLHVTQRGQPPGQPLTLHLQEYHDIIVLKSQSLRPDQTIYRAVSDPDAEAQTFEATHGVLVGGPAVLKPRLDYPPTLEVPAGQSSVSLKVRVLSPGPAALAFSITPDVDLSILGPWWGQAYFSGVRSYAEDDYSHIPDDKLTWEFVYNEVLRTYYILYPAMSLYFPLNSEQSVKAMGPQILERMAPQAFLTTGYMPISRSLSPGRVELLRRWLSKP